MNIENTEQFEKDVIKIINNLDGTEISCFDNEANPDICSRVIIASFLSNRQIIVAIEKIIRHAKAVDHVAKCPHRKKNIDTEWTAIDCGDLIIHLFKDEVRGYYELDKFYMEGI